MAGAEGYEKEWRSEQPLIIVLCRCHWWGSPMGPIAASDFFGSSLEAGTKFLYRFWSFFEVPEEEKFDPSAEISDLKTTIRIQIMDIGSAPCECEVSLSQSVTEQITELVRDKSQFQKLREALATRKTGAKMRLVSSEPGRMVCDIGDDVTFRYIANLFEIRCPALVQQVVFFVRERESKKSQTESAIPRFTLMFYNTHFATDYYFANQKLHRIEKIFMGTNPLTPKFQFRAEQKENPSQRCQQINSTPVKSRNPGAIDNVSIAVNHPAGLIVKSKARAPAGGSSRQFAHITSYSLIAKRIMRTCQPKLHGAILTVDLSPLRELIGCIYVCLDGDCKDSDADHHGASTEIDKKKFKFINDIRQISCVNNCLQPILTEVTWILQRYFNKIPEIRFKFEADGWKGYNVTTKSSESMAEHMDFVAALKASERGKVYNVNKLSFFLARHIFLYGESNSVTRTAREEHDYSEIKDHVNEIVLLFKQTVANRWSDNQLFAQLLQIFTEDVEKLLTKQFKYMESMITKWNKEKKEFFEEHTDIRDFWSQTVNMPFNVLIERRKTADMEKIQTCLQGLLKEMSESMEKLKELEIELSPAASRG
eukprot:347431-Hanusia_phi.AAC.1